MIDLAFYVDAARSGSILGVGPGSTADEIQNALGRDFVDDARRGRMRRDYGLVEFQFNRSGSGWLCFGMAIQVHRLPSGGTRIIPAALRDRYGQLAASVDADLFAQALAMRGGQIVREGVEGEFTRYRVDGTSSFVHVHEERQELIGEGGSGDVWSIEIRGPGTVRG
ncbi:hypothetical protein ACLQ26_11185 [Micromonospora sp. DT43]|uniref:hypothetical protein n=1 Tax=Micromonospora sp. DT43 TaxID=3393440 RepID=UPI003CF9F722